MRAWLYQITPARAGMPESPTPDEEALVGRHFAYLKAAFEAGIARSVGRTASAPHLGLAVLHLPDEAAAHAFLAGDPAVAAGVFVGRIQPFHEVLVR